MCTKLHTTHKIDPSQYARGYDPSPTESLTHQSRSARGSTSTRNIYFSHMVFQDQNLRRLWKKLFPSSNQSKKGQKFHIGGRAYVKNCSNFQKLTLCILVDDTTLSILFHDISIELDSILPHNIWELLLCGGLCFILLITANQSN